MTERHFFHLLSDQWKRNNFVCVGLDSDFGQIPEPARRSTIEETIYAFNCSIVDATSDSVCAYKPNIAFYEGQGVAGISALIRTIEYILQKAPSVPVILDAKRADIGSTNKGYVTAAFQVFKADAITVHPYLGAEALQPFLDQANKGIIVLCRTSNPGAKEVQDLKIEGEPVYRIIARRVSSEWNKNNNCALVVGATYPAELREVRELVGDMPLLIPGIGAQGGDVEKTVGAGMDSRKQGMIINSSRGIIFASKGQDFAEAARRETLKLKDMINQYRS